MKQENKLYLLFILTAVWLCLFTSSILQESAPDTNWEYPYRGTIESIQTDISHFSSSDVLPISTQPTSRGVQKRNNNNGRSVYFIPTGGNRFAQQTSARLGACHTHAVKSQRLIPRYYIIQRNLRI